MNWVGIGKTCVSVVVAAGLFVSAAQAASGDGLLMPGEYRGSAKGVAPYDLSVFVDAEGVADIRTSGERCVGTGRFVMSGGVAKMIKAQQCELSYEHKALGVFVIREGAGCAKLHGFECSFSGEVRFASNMTARPSVKQNDGNYVAGQVSGRLGNAIERANAFDADRYRNDRWSQVAGHAVESVSNWATAAQVSVDGLQACYALRSVADKRKAEQADGMLEICRNRALTRLKAAADIARKLNAPSFPEEAIYALVNLAEVAEEGVKALQTAY